VGRVLGADLAHMAERLHAGLAEMPRFRFVDKPGADLAEPDLDGHIAVFFNTFELRDNAGACFYHGNRHDFSPVIEDLGHTDFLAQYCVYHDGLPVILLPVSAAVSTLAPAPGCSRRPRLLAERWLYHGHPNDP